jgi:hypothetical protein
LGPLRLPGVSFRERLSGTYWRLDAPTDERAIVVDLEMNVPHWRAFLQSRAASLSGHIDADGLASRRPIRGTVAFELLEERRNTYAFSFEGDDGRGYELCGQKEWHALAPLEAITLLPASLYDARGDEVARTTLRFNVRADWARLLASVRWVDADDPPL